MKEILSFCNKACWKNGLNAQREKHKPCFILKKNKCDMDYGEKIFV